MDSNNFFHGTSKRYAKLILTNGLDPKKCTALCFCCFARNKLTALSYAISYYWEDVTVLKLKDKNDVYNRLIDVIDKKRTEYGVVITSDNEFLGDVGYFNLIPGEYLEELTISDSEIEEAKKSSF